MTKQKRRILIIDNSTFVTGALKSIVGVAHDIRSDFEFHFVISKNSRGRYFIEDAGFTSIYEVPLLEISRRPLSILMYIPVLLKNSLLLTRLVKKLKIELIHTNDLYNLLPLGAKLFGMTVPYVCQIRFLPEKFPKALFQMWLRLHLTWSRKIITVSYYLLGKLPRHQKITCVHDQLPFVETYPADVKPVPSRILYISNFIRGKGQQYALNAFALLHEKYPKWKIRFVGSDMGLKKNRVFKRELQTYCALHSLSDKVEWENFTRDPETEFKAADLVLNFSESESFSRTCMEALYYGRPIVATDSGGPAEIIDHGITGYLVPKKDINAMVEAMEKLMSNPELRARFGKEGRIRVRQKFSIEKTSFKMAEYYLEALKPQ
jgi:L-malate glycosyltransferase